MPTQQAHLARQEDTPKSVTHSSALVDMQNVHDERLCQEEEAFRSVTPPELFVNPPRLSVGDVCCTPQDKNSH